MSAISYAPILINEYISEKVTERLSEHFSESMKIFPSLPTDINSLSESFPAAASDVFASYDRMIKFRRTPFPHIKTEQVMYYLYKMNSDPEALIEATQVIADLLDRGDESAQELNSWVAGKSVNGIITFGTGTLARNFKPVFFHETRIFQLEEARDVKTSYTTRSYMASKMIIDYKYHTKNYL